MRPKIVQVCSHLPPEVSGVGDYVAVLTTALKAEGATSHVVSCTTAGKPEGIQLERFEKGDAADLADALTRARAETVLLHYSGYGFDPAGCCGWLAEGLEQWRASAPGRKLLTIFHEVYATGPLWRTSFWTSLPQRAVARRIGGFSDAAIVTSEGGAAQLRPLAPNLPLTVMPVFSNIGEPPTTPPLALRKPYAIAFGLAPNRTRLYAALARLPSPIKDAFRGYGLTRILDIGPPTGVPCEVLGLPVESLRSLPANTVSAHLSSARMGLLDYPWHVLTKSGVFAAYVAHGTLALNLSANGTLPPDLREGREFAHPYRLINPSFDAQTIAQRGRTWYAGHSASAMAAQILSFVT